MMSDADVKLKWKEASQESRFPYLASSGASGIVVHLPRATLPSSDTYLASQHVRNSSTTVPECVRLRAGTR